MATHIYKEKYVQDDGNERVVRQTAVNNPPKPVGAYRIFYYILDVLEVLLAFRLVFKALAAAAGNAFVNFIYSLTAPFVAPFRGIFPSTASGTMLLEWSTVVAMVVYALIVYAIARLIDTAVTA